jgi:diguanylate cyclase (GGDEF)-like protein
VNEAGVEPLAATPEQALPRSPARIAELRCVREVVAGRMAALPVRGEAAAELAATAGLRDDVESALLLPMRTRAGTGHILTLLDSSARDYSAEEIEVAGAFAAAAAASLAQLALAEEHASQVAQQAALARAAKTLNASLDLNRVLVRICKEAKAILDADKAGVYVGNAEEGMRVEAAAGFPPEVIGYRMAPGEGLSGKVAMTGEPMLENDYRSMSGRPASSLFGDVRCCLAVPMVWDGQLRGVLSVGYTRQHIATTQELSLLEAFAEIAAAACRNASQHAGVAMAARTDALTGCLNHAALHDALEREIGRCERGGYRLALTVVDLDHFKQVNEEHGHLVGDEVLRRVGHALRQGVRGYDVVARYGGDEFALVAVEASEEEAAELAARAVESITRSLEDLEERPAGAGATAGVAEWQAGETPAQLIERADQALLFGKQRSGRGCVVMASEMPAEFRPIRVTRPRPSSRAADGGDSAWPISPRDQTERLRKRTRQLSLANALGTRLAAMTDAGEIFEATVSELQRAFSYHLCAVIRARDDGFVESVAVRGEAFERLGARAWSQPRSAGLIGRCLRERSPVVSGDVKAEPDYRATDETFDTRSELVAPIWVGDELWGALNVEEVEQNAFDEDDVRLVQTMADQVGSALRSAMLYDRLERAYLGTAEALAAALEAKDAYTAAHSRSIVHNAERVGRRLQLDDADLRNLRFGAIFHDIGKIAVPEAILHKRGPLTEEEWLEVQKHPVVGERILASVDFLSDVLPLVRHEHERWDGGGYPDGLAGEGIPLGARIILACDAYDAMTTDRPYRPAMSDERAREELVRGAGAQFDPRVVGALLEILDEDEPGAPQEALSEAR